ncbi:MAG TPA: hypothetical protein VK149_08825 [Sideroxyarcus sp.]|nr:hypothetical protein [Sideroxyarcus sp.]
MIIFLLLLGGAAAASSLAGAAAGFVGFDILRFLSVRLDYRANHLPPSGE